MLLASMPFCYGAFRAYHRPLNDVIQPVLRAHKIPSAMIEKAEEPIRRAVASVVAARALKVSTLASIGGFGIMGAMVFYTCGWNSFNQAVATTQDWAHVKRNYLDQWLGVKNRIDRNHPESDHIKGMSHEEELDYISRVYLPDENWEEDVKENS
jgi:hypothetical protein